ncbi:hypothetical protein BHE90_015477 [Fusarium euwallaceae]|uniref:WSC domain-containing protein n=1 Tax=Fusarium euwallaceae TaxID=1147111 RepID=A0A430L305_9HYPO|nr:hypothetical protein BHE90_015477 [Fusarium euwallaceae]
MRYTEILALAMGNLAAAQFSTTQFTNSSSIATSTEPATDTATSASSSSTSTAEPSHPDTVGNFRFLGCIGSDDGFPTFILAADSEDNTLESCAAACEGSNYFGTYDNTCYCGVTLNVATTDILSSDACDISCPGDETQACGGIRSSSRLRRRQSVDISVLLSIYISIDFNPDGTTDTVTNTVTAVETETLPPVTTTATVTTVIDGTTTVTAVTTVIAVVPTDVVIICYGNYCAPQVHCPTCTKWQIVCEDGHCAPRECHDNNWDRLVICESGLCHYADWKEEECNQRIVCYGSDCTWDRTPHKDYQKKFIRYEDDWCFHEECVDDCWTYNVCKENCVVVPPPKKTPITPPKPCVPGDKVILPPPTKVTPPCKDCVIPPPVDCSGDKCIPDKPTKPTKPVEPVKPVEPCVGDKCHDKPTKPVIPVEPCTGDHCEPKPEPSKPVQPPVNPPVNPPSKPTTPSTPVEPCTGDHCETDTEKPTVPVVTAGASAMLPASGLAFAIAGVAFLL